MAHGVADHDSQSAKPSITSQDQEKHPDDDLYLEKGGMEFSPSSDEPGHSDFLTTRDAK